MPKHTREEALFFHQRLPRRIRRTLREAGLSDELIHRRLLGWDGERITVPVFGRDRKVVRMAHLSDPLDSGGLGPIEEERFAPAEIYGWEILQARPGRLFITADPWDRLLLEGRGFRAIGLVGEPATFKTSWVEDFKGVQQVLVAFPGTGRAHRAARRIAELVPQARLIYQPPTLGEGGIAEYFLSQRRSLVEFLRLLPPRESQERHEGGEAA